MKNKILIISIFAAILMILLPISAVVGTNIAKSDGENINVVSPLFTNRINRVLRKDSNKISSNYIGKGTIFKLFPVKKMSLSSYIDKAIKIINAKPELLNKVIDKIDTIPGVVNILRENAMNIDDFKNHINNVKNDPNLLKEEVEYAIQTAGANLELTPDDPEPLGFSGQFGCLIAFIILLPIIVMIATMIATFTIVTCLNIGGCFETIMKNILESFAQGLTP